jgi:uncharacterized membrane protein
MWLFDTDNGLPGAMRIAHVVFAVMWMGLLWFFNFIQTPAYADMEAGARNNAFDKLTWRALWWFRHAAWMTVVSGLLILLLVGFDEGGYDGDFFKSPEGGMLAAAILLGLIMLYNVWMVIWPNQQIVINNARTVQGGGAADPAAPAAARKAAMASRQNMIFSFTVFLGMVGASHFFGGYRTDDRDVPGGGVRVLFYLLVLAFAGVMEANSLGVFGTEAGKPNTWMYDKHQNAIYFAVGTVVFWVLFFEIAVGSPY